MNKPIIGITMGDPAGIGTEIIGKAFSDKMIYEICNPVLIGDKNAIDDGIRIAGSAIKTRSIENVSDANFEFGVIDVLDLKNVDMKEMKYGKVSAMCGKASGQYIEKAVDLAVKKEINAITTCPIHKDSFQSGGYLYPGHTEMLAQLTNTKKFTMMLTHGDFRTIHVSTHVSLKEACERVKKDRILHVINLANEGCKALGIKEPRIAVAGLNPHAGEYDYRDPEGSPGGIFGDEEIKEIIPAVKAAQEQGINAVGPIPGDTVYPQSLKGGKFDIVVSMFHDQGHIPMKLKGFVYDADTKDFGSINGVNTTIGMPIIRTSVDHGTAFGKAGKGTANCDSLKQALQSAVRLAKSGYYDNGFQAS